MKIPFDIKFRPQIESGEYKVETRDGSPARVVCWDRAAKGYEPKDLKLCVLVQEYGGESAYYYYSDGTIWVANDDYNLFIVTPEPELTEFEEHLKQLLDFSVTLGSPYEMDCIKSEAAELLDLARKEFVKQGYVIEKKAFHDAVEKIDDKHKAEMSVEYSLHCKVENGTRHAVMNWEEFQKVAQHFIDCGKAEALKDLPRWKKCGVDTGQTNLIRGYSRDEDMLYRNGRKISLMSLEKLPGFKEDESHE